MPECRELASSPEPEKVHFKSMIRGYFLNVVLKNVVFHTRRQFQRQLMQFTACTVAKFAASMRIIVGCLYSGMLIHVNACNILVAYSCVGTNSCDIF